jgi:hypothetical protein
MRYRITVYKYTDGATPFYDREFHFGESAHKVTDVINQAADQLEAEGGPGPGSGNAGQAGIDPRSTAYRVHAHAFNTLTAMLAPVQFVPLSEREAITRAIVAVVEPIIREDERALVAQELNAAQGFTQREQLAWLMYCYQQGYTDPADRAVLTNWLGDDPATLHPDDVPLQRNLLGMADEILALLPQPERSLCPSGCGCRVGPDKNGDFDADHRDCSCDGQCTAIPLERRSQDTESDQRILAALMLASSYGGTDGAHHKQWLIDQMVRALTGCTAEGESPEYAAFTSGRDWDGGITP